MTTLPQSYSHTEAEARWQRRWEDSQVYAWDSTQPRANTYVIDTPPPTVSGHLHMGHIFSYTQADFIARYQRMKGKTVFYPMGFDDNGLPTERLVEKIKGKKAAQYDGREAFIEDCLEVSAEARQAFRRLFTSTALSVDWAQEYHTISEDARRISQMSFLDLHRKGKAYRQLQPMLWDPVDQTAIAQAEVVDKEMPSHFTDIAFTVEETGEELIIGTTRPELLPACVAVFVHPEDTRYAALVGKHALTPLFGVRVEIRADEKVQIDKGTGAVMCCTFGDETDIHWWKTHNLPTRVILNKYGKLQFIWRYHGGIADGKKELPEGAAVKAIGFSRSQELLTAEQFVDFSVAYTRLMELEGLKPEAARTKMLSWLTDANLVRKQDAITHTVKTAERSGAVLELLPTHQWFVRVLEAKDELKARSKECAWHPEWMAHRMEQWIDGLNWDWCISRQRYFGVPFPVWYEYDPTSPFDTQVPQVVFADVAQLPANPLVDLPKGYVAAPSNTAVDMLFTDSDGSRAAKGRACINPQGKNVWLEPDRDVMDTWATSSVSPQLNSHAVSETLPGDLTRYKQLFPADLRPQAHEIIRTWAFYTLVKSHYHADTPPWGNLMISGWCLAEDKSKMSKSKGNIVTPVGLIEEHSADAVRYWASTARLGADTAFSKDVLKIGRKLVTKLWNATKFAAIQLESLEAPGASAVEDSGRISEALDQWILTRLGKAIAKATDAFEDYEYANARAALEDFFWNDFCDNYLEMVKARAYDAEGKNPAGKLSAQLAIHHCLDGILRGFAPIVPHVTEELWSHLFPASFARFGSIHARGTWPKAADYPLKAEAEASGIAAVDVLEAIRKAKSEGAVSIKYPVQKIVLSGAADQANWALLAPVAEDVKAAGNVSELAWADQAASGAQPSESGRFLLGITLAPQADVA